MFGNLFSKKSQNNAHVMPNEAKQFVVRASQQRKEFVYRSDLRVRSANDDQFKEALNEARFWGIRVVG